MKLLITLCCVLGFSLQSYTQQDAPSPILFIYDASGSMWGQLDGKSKKVIASEVLSTSVNNLPSNQNIGLMAYGHRQKGDCNDIEFLVDLKNNSKSNITNAVSNMKALGKTPLARSASLAINSLKKTNTKATIILITDGIESCDGDVCKVVSEAKASGIDFKLHIVGFGLKESETTQLKCAANAGGGNYYDASNASALGEVLTEATTQTVDKPDGNFSIYASKNGQAVDAWINVTKSGTKEVVDGSRTYRDSGWVYLPPGTYDIAIRPLEGSDIPGTSITVNMEEGDIKHKNISFDGGTLEVTATNNDEGWDTVVKMLDINTGKVVANTRTYGRTKTMEVPAGLYKITFQALVMKGNNTYFEIDKIEINSNETTSISHNFETGKARIGVKTSNGELVDAGVNFIDINSGKRITGGRTYTSDKSNPREFLLNPGTYKVEVRSLGAHVGHNETFTIEVKQAETVTKIITF
ncbi:vWA domain-containing protein [Psychroserpens mesophilus]|uniref:vWA domain-containing protein n=1 Tax=Psychroserpens mesophilus TaxID=325473 RepID=UPI003D64656B